MCLKTIVAVTIGLYVALVLTGAISSDKKLGPPEYAIIVFAVLFVGNFFDKLAEISFGKEGFRFQLNAVRDRQQQIEELLAAIQVVLGGLITKYEYKHLQDLCAPEPCMRKFGHIFFSEIKSLDAIGFLRPAPSSNGFNAIKDHHEHDANDFDLKQYMEITDEGRAYVRIRSTTELRKSG